MVLFGIAGWSGSGKTTLIERLVPALRARGLRVSTIKHAHHGLEVDRPGKDSFRHREAGAEEVLVLSGQRWALMRERAAGEPEPDLFAVARRLAPVDLVLVEGFKHAELDKIEVWRAATGQPLRAPDDGHVVAVAADPRIDVAGRPCFALDDVDAIATFVVRHTGLG